MALRKRSSSSQFSTRKRNRCRLVDQRSPTLVSNTSRFHLTTYSSKAVSAMNVFGGQETERSCGQSRVETGIQAGACVRAGGSVHVYWVYPYLLPFFSGTHQSPVESAH